MNERLFMVPIISRVAELIYMKDQDCSASFAANLMAHGKLHGRSGMSCLKIQLLQNA